MTIFHAIPAIPYEHRAGEAGPELRPLFANRAAMAHCILDLLDASAAEMTASEPGPLRPEQMVAEARTRR
jgi:hypothetical protein